MKKLTIIFAFVAMLAMSGCVQNNGHIGHWFGLWKVERVTIDGQDDADYKGNVFFAFQGAVFGVRHTGRHNMVRTMGRFGKKRLHID